MLPRRPIPVVPFMSGDRPCLHCLYRTVCSAFFVAPLQRQRLAEHRGFKSIVRSPEHPTIKSTGAAAFHTGHLLSKPSSGTQRRKAVSARKRLAVKARKAGNATQSGTERKSKRVNSDTEPSLDEDAEQQDGDCDVQNRVRNVESKRKRKARFITSRPARLHTEAAGRPAESMEPGEQSTDHEELQTLEVALKGHPIHKSAIRAESGSLNSSDLHFEGSPLTSALNSLTDSLRYKGEAATGTASCPRLGKSSIQVRYRSVSYTHLTLPTKRIV